MHLSRLCSALLALSTTGTLLKRLPRSLEGRGFSIPFSFWGLHQTLSFSTVEEIGFLRGDLEMCSEGQASRKQIRPGPTVMRLDLPE